MRERMVVRDGGDALWSMSRTIRRPGGPPNWERTSHTPPSPTSWDFSCVQFTLSSHRPHLSSTACQLGASDTLTNHPSLPRFLVLYIVSWTNRASKGRTSTFILYDLSLLSLSLSLCAFTYPSYRVPSPLFLSSLPLPPVPNPTTHPPIPILSPSPVPFSEGGAWTPE